MNPSYSDLRNELHLSKQHLLSITSNSIMDFGEEDNSYTSDEGRNGENIQLIPNDTVKRVVVRKPIPLVKRGGKMKDKMNRYIRLVHEIE